MTTAPHPTPEERYEAAVRRAESRFKGGGRAAYMLDVRNEMIAAIREAEAAGEARGRASCPDCRLNRLAKSMDDFRTAADELREIFRARTDKESSDD